MALRGVLANWALAGAVVAGFGVVTLLGPSAPTEGASSDPSAPDVDNTPTSEPDISTPPTTEPLANPPENEPANDDPIAEIDPVDPPAPDETNTPALFPSQLEICGSMAISNRPESVDELTITNYTPTVLVNGVSLAVAPVEDACFSSGFGPRGSSIHKGIDLHNSNPVQVYAAASGTVKEKQYRDDYGNMLVLDHGNGVYTRYAHLESFADGLVFAETVNAGDPIGIMGNTASYSIPRHLHYELLTGEWGALSGSFGLTAINIMAQLPDN